MSLSGEPDTAELSSATTQRANNSGPTEDNMATVLQGLQTTLAQLAKNSELQTEAIQNLKEDILLCSGDEDTEDTPALENWKLNMKRRELIKPELNPPYTRLCKEDIAVSTKLFGDDLPKHLKDMSEAKKKQDSRCKNLIPTVPIGVQCTRKKGILADSSLTIMTGHEALATKPTASLFWGKAARQHRSGKSNQPATTTPTTKLSLIQLSKGRRT